jgi:Fe-S-cluster containining protein
VSGDDLTEYQALVDKVDAFAAAVTGRRREDLRCGPGCAACCQVQLSVSPVEAAAIRRHLRGLPEAERAAIAAAAAAASGGGAGGACVMLRGDGTCAIYAARPLVCRTQGLPLRYPAGVIPKEAVMARAQARGADMARARARADGVTWCPLNFTAGPPQGADVLDAGRVDEILALVSRRHAARTGEDPLSRHALVDLVG